MFINGAFGLMATAGLVLLTSCAIVTINVNFPAQEVREAYEELEDELLIEPGEEGSPGARLETAPGVEHGYAAAEPEMTITVKRMFFLKRFIETSLTPAAWAAVDISESIESEVKKMPEVLEAYKTRSARVVVVNGMLRSGVVGEGSKGLLIQRGDISPSELRVLNAENADRETIITGMAKAILKFNNLPVTSGKVREINPQAATQFAAVRRGKAQVGSLIQLPDGRWVKK